MKEYKYQLNPIQAVAVINTIFQLTGDGEHKKYRRKIIDELLKVYPEVDPEEEPEVLENLDKEQTREVTIKSKSLKAFVDGLVDVISDRKTQDGALNSFIKIAGHLRVANSMLKKIPDGKLEDFGDDLDGDEDLELDETEPETKD